MGCSGLRLPRIPTCSLARMAPQIPRIISVDDHVIEPPNVWQDRLPEKFKAVGPRIERRKVKNMKFVGGIFSYDTAADNEDGLWCDWWLVEICSTVLRLKKLSGSCRTPCRPTSPSCRAWTQR